ncbi:MAG: very short patch repair endonuclease [Muribaculaceae bacterium]|nr:very short patch repair endonuclease [Muribaculaceae bacterium]
MTDRMTPEQRHRCMAAIKGKDTRPEILVRKYLFSKGLRYRVNDKRLPGSPDIVLKKYKTVIFIDGCFWHAHKGCKYYKMPKTNVDFWRAKIARNIARDYVNNVDLELAGWRVIRVWECEVKTKAKRDETLKNLYHSITGLNGKSTVYEEAPQSDIDIAAEPHTEYGE